MKQTLTACMLAIPLVAMAQNPVIRDQFTADPTARVINNKVYLYPSHDIPAPEGQRQDWFCMADYHVFSSSNLTQWTDHGTILSQQQVPWGKPDGFSMWAPDCVEKDGTYYFYFPNAPEEGRGFAIGVATAKQPEGPFTCEAEPIKGVTGIDPCCLIDNDGQAYLYWSGMGIRGAKLKANMKELDGELQTISMAPPANDEALAKGKRLQPQRIQVGGELMEGLPEGFKEGPFVFRRGDWYYLTFPWVRGSKENGANPTETLAYAMSKNPLGPWDFKGIIMAEHANGCWTNHHSIVNYQGQWYLFYHHNDFSPRDDKRRSVCIERVHFNTDGTIQEVKPTLRGVGINQATERIEIDRYSSASKDVTTQIIDTVNTFRGYEVFLPQKGSWVRYEQVNFNNITDGYLVICAKALDNTEFFVREKQPKGKIVARVKMTVKSEQGPFRRDQSGQWLTLSVPLEYTPKDITDLVVTCEDKGVSIDWLQFKNRPHYFTSVDKNAAPAQPDEQGFIHRWKLLEPLPQDIRSNVIFTNSWLRQKFTAELEKFNKQKKQKWYVFDSPTYNMRLFRFAEKYGRQAYGNLFWVETVFDCAEELSNVRLAAGTNGASMWWLNDEEVLLLEGDRRMVEDDGVSKRVTLKKGRNVLRCAVINGPGLSDLCARFIDSKGDPIKNYQVTLTK